MCKAFSCIISKDKKVTWKFVVDSHNALIDLAGFKDEDDTKKFVRVEIVPKNSNYLFPDKWELKIDSPSTPNWWSPAHEEECFKAHKGWKRKLATILIRKPIVHPFKLKAVQKVTLKQKLLLKEWDSVRGSVRDSVWDSVRDSVGDSVRDSVRDSVWDSVEDSVEDSVWDSVRGYTGSFFKLEKWKYTEKIKTTSYPFQSVVDLWEMGLVPSFDGTTWRLHAGKKAKVVFKIKAKDLQKLKAKSPKQVS